MEELFEQLYYFCKNHNAKFEFSVVNADVRYIRIDIRNKDYAFTNLIDATHDAAELIMLIECILKECERKFV